MNLQGIIAIAGKPGLYKVIGQGKNNVIVESIMDGKRFPAYARHQISAISDITLYTYEEDLPLGEAYGKLFEIQKGEAGPKHKGDMNELKDLFARAVPDFDEDRVRDSDIRKFFQWYNMLHSAGLLVVEEEEKAAEEEKAESEKKAEDKKPAEKKPAAKKPAAKKSEEKKPAAKKTTAKKAESKDGEKKAAAKKPAAKKPAAKKTTTAKKDSSK